jgi:diadenosine tetraphosphate (Ap4A) HIT family hydrolase
MCANTRTDETPYGVRVFSGKWADGYLGRFPLRRGYSYVVWHGRHVAEPTQLTDEEAAGFWKDVLTVGRAIEERYRPCKMNYELLGNGVPHLHAHLIPRYLDDAAAGGPLPREDWNRAFEQPVLEAELRSESQALRSLLRP